MSTSPPALADIDPRPRASRRAIATKLAQDVALGPVGVGLAAHLPLVVRLGLVVQPFPSAISIAEQTKESC
jgi:hypothetical protein